MLIHVCKAEAIIRGDATAPVIGDHRRSSTAFWRKSCSPLKRCPLTAHTLSLSLSRLGILICALVVPRCVADRYFPFLPARPPSALHWSSGQIGRMEGMALPQQVADCATPCVRLRAAFSSLFIDLPDVFPPDRKEAFSSSALCGLFNRETRGLVLELEPGAKTTALVPFADMLNHKVSAALGGPRSNAVKDGRVGPAGVPRQSRFPSVAGCGCWE